MEYYSLLTHLRRSFWTQFDKYQTNFQLAKNFLQFIKIHQIQGNPNGYIVNTLNFYFECLFLFEMKTLFSKNFEYKCLAIAIIGFSFVFVFFIISIYFLIRYFYSNEAESLFENCVQTKFGIFFLTFQVGFKNLALGLVHLFFQESYIYQTSILIGLQLILLINCIYFTRLKRFQCLVSKSKQWINIIAGMLRFFMILTFLVEPNLQSNTVDSLQLSNFSEMYSIFFSIYICILWPFSTLIELSYLVSSLTKIYKIKQEIVSANNRGLFGVEIKKKSFKTIYDLKLYNLQRKSQESIKLETLIPFEIKNNNLKAKCSKLLTHQLSQNKLQKNVNFNLEHKSNDSKKQNKLHTKKARLVKKIHSTLKINQIRCGQKQLKSDQSIIGV